MSVLPALACLLRRRLARVRALPAATVVCLAVIGLAGCAASAPPVAQVDEAAVRHYREGGYSPGAPVAIETRRINGPVTEAPWTATLVQPADHAVHPLIVFLPSLGEDDTAPVQWCATWARAGYAVLTLQALADDAQAWSTADARSGDFERVARARYADDLMADRVARLSVLLDQIRQRSGRGEAGLQALDWNRVTLAGADLGAYTVQTIAAGAATVHAGPWSLSPLAYIAISPYARRASPPPDARPRPEHAPMLMISGRDDVDAYGVVTDPRERHLAFDRLGPGPSYFLELGHANHRWLGGDTSPLGGGETARRPAPPPGEPGGGTQRRRRGPGGGGENRDGMAPESDDEDPASEKAAKAVHAEQEVVRSRALTQSALDMASFESVSIAFLDASVRQQAAARAWLQDRAPLWLKNGDRLKQR